MTTALIVLCVLVLLNTITDIILAKVIAAALRPPKLILTTEDELDYPPFPDDPGAAIAEMQKPINGPRILAEQKEFLDSIRRLREWISDFRQFPEPDYPLMTDIERLIEVAEKKVRPIND